jgi:dihydrofolate reductase
MKERCIIAAVDNNNAIGYKGDLLVRIPKDLKRFKELTTGNIVIMGRKTYESIGRPLPNRQNIIISSHNISLPDCTNSYIVSSLTDAYKLAENLEGEKVYVIGGGQVYEQAIDWTNTIELTEIWDEFSNADTFFPASKMKGCFELTNATDWYWSEDRWIQYRFATYKRVPTTN